MTLHSANSVTVFELHHFKIHPDGTDEIENRGFNGIFSSPALAAAAAARLILNEGYRDWPNGFRLFPVTLDADRWPRGFEGEDIQEFTPDKGEVVVPRAMPPGQRGPRQSGRTLDAADMLYPLLHFPISARSEDMFDDPSWKCVGVYTTPERQQAAMHRARFLPGFRRWPHGFRLMRENLDRCDLEAGFINPDIDWPPDS